jgi:SRSO17 transposase
MIGQNIKYLVLASERPIAALIYNRAALRVGVRDDYIGWTEEIRRQNIKYIVNNNRFLILPWVKVKNLASHILSQSLTMIRKDWEDIYGYQPQLAETFVDGDRFEGTCYLASNWRYVGETRGYGKCGKAFKFHGQRKKVFLYELNTGFIKSQASHLKRPLRRKPPAYRKRQWEDVTRLLGIRDWSKTLLESVGITADSMEEFCLLLKTFVSTFDSCFSNSAQKPHFMVYLKGLLSDLERKSVEPIALRYGGETKVRLMQLFMSSSPWSDEKMLAIYQCRLSEEVSEEDGMITADGCDFPKKGTESVGVSRQYCGPLGKTDSCQASVMIGYSGSNGYGLIGRRLYLPEKWMTDEYAEKRKKCGIPDDVKFMAKNEIAIDLIQSSIRSGLFKGKWIGADSAFGHDTKFIDAAPAGMYYFAEVPCDDRFYAAMPESASAGLTGIGGKQTIVQAEDPAAVSKIISESNVPWNKAVLGLGSIGSKGLIAGEEKLLRVFDVRNGCPNKLIWLYARKLADGSIKYAISNAPQDTPPEKFRNLALRRWAIEQCFEECKSDLGMGHFEGRSWTGWHRHILITFTAQLFLLQMRKKFSADVHQLTQNGQVAEGTSDHTAKK